ncbi:MAG TPA: type II toxin-antitoxin system VapC family toxin [Candidatus Nanoarchaeia archaeon]|nr:type II toxin-antitoxin system VapC family toxin [Candidatus Nanoarchaeia archaeon]
MSERTGKKCKYLLDTSALYPMLLSGIIFSVDDCAVSTLTEYEIGNVLWRENKQGKLKNPDRIATIFSESIMPLMKLKFDSIAKVLEIATDRNLTFYDALYAYIAESQNVKLVTQDSDLLKKCKAAIPIDKME